MPQKPLRHLHATANGALTGVVLHCVAWLEVDSHLREAELNLFFFWGPHAEAFQDIIRSCALLGFTGGIY